MTSLSGDKLATDIWVDVSESRPYAFSSFSLLGRIIIKIISDKIEKAILIIPFWPVHSLFSLLKAILISLSVILPYHSKSLCLGNHL